MRSSPHHTASPSCKAPTSSQQQRFPPPRHPATRQVGEYLLQKQNECGVKLLWGTANLFSNPRYMNGAGTNPDVHTFAYAGAQVKRVMALTHKLGGENYVFWGGREGYQSLLNTSELLFC